MAGFNLGRWANCHQIRSYCIQLKEPVFFPYFREGKIQFIDVKAVRSIHKNIRAVYESFVQGQNHQEKSIRCNKSNIFSYDLIICTRHWLNGKIVYLLLDDGPTITTRLHIKSIKYGLEMDGLPFLEVKKMTTCTEHSDCAIYALDDARSELSNLCYQKRYPIEFQRGGQLLPRNSINLAPYLVKKKG